MEGTEIQQCHCALNTPMSRDHRNSWGLLCTENTVQCSTSSAQLCSQLFSLCFFQLRNASHGFWTQDIPAPVTTDLQGRDNTLRDLIPSPTVALNSVQGEELPQLKSPAHFKHSTTFWGSKERSLKSFPMRDIGFSYALTSGFGIWNLGSRSCCPLYNPGTRVAVSF